MHFCFIPDPFPVVIIDVIERLVGCLPNLLKPRTLTAEMAEFEKLVEMTDG